MLLSHFFGFSRKRPAQRPTDRRTEERYEAYHPVTIGPSGSFSYVEGTVINVSIGGAAVHVPGWGARAPAEWLSGLHRGGELQMTGLLEAPLPCRVVTVDAGVIRVQFARDDAQRAQLRELIETLASP
jgi:hypothetical protein